MCVAFLCTSLSVPRLGFLQMVVSPLARSLHRTSMGLILKGMEVRLRNGLNAGIESQQMRTESSKVRL